MKVTREVIYDLLPSYFAGDASDDTRALVEAYFETDPGVSLAWPPASSRSSPSVNLPAARP
jgi:hypothetical protein